MTITESIRDILSRRKSINPEWADGISACWKEEIRILSKSPEDTVSYLRDDCSDEELYLLGEIFEDVIAATKSSEILTAMKDRIESVKDLEKKQSLLQDFAYAAGALITIVDEL